MNDNHFRIKNYPIPMRQKTAARIAAVQFSFQRLFVEDISEITLADFLEYYAPDVAEDLHVKEIDISHFQQLVFSFDINRPMVEELISRSLSSGWSVERLSKAEFTILFVAICELKFVMKTPTKVILAEYIAIADAYNCDIGFINAILDKNAKLLRQNEILSSFKQ